VVVVFNHSTASVNSTACCENQGIVHPPVAEAALHTVSASPITILSLVPLCIALPYRGRIISFGYVGELDRLEEPWGRAGSGFSKACDRMGCANSREQGRCRRGAKAEKVVIGQNTHEESGEKGFGVGTGEPGIEEELYWSQCEWERGERGGDLRHGAEGWAAKRCRKLCNGHR